MNGACWAPTPDSQKSTAPQIHSASAENLGRQPLTPKSPYRLKPTYFFPA